MLITIGQLQSILQCRCNDLLKFKVSDRAKKMIWVTFERGAVVDAISFRLLPEWEDGNENETCVLVSGVKGQSGKVDHRNKYSSCTQLQPGSAFLHGNLNLAFKVDALDTQHPLCWRPNYNQVYLIIWLGSLMYHFLFNWSKQLSHRIDILCTSQSSVSHSSTAARRMWALNLLSCPSLTRRPRAIQTIMLWVIHKCHSPSALLRCHTTHPSLLLAFPTRILLLTEPVFGRSRQEMPKKNILPPRGGSIAGQ